MPQGSTSEMSRTTHFENKCQIILSFNYGWFVGGLMVMQFANLREAVNQLGAGARNG